MAEKQVHTYPTDKLYVKGQQLQHALYARATQLESLRATLLEEIASKIQAACAEDENPMKKVAALLVVLEDNTGLSAHALEMQAFIARAAEVQRQHRRLSLLGRSLMPEAIYEVSPDEAELYGL